MEGLYKIYSEELEKRDSIHWDDTILSLLTQYQEQEYDAGDETILSEMADAVLQCASSHLVVELSRKFVPIFLLVNCPELRTDDGDFRYAFCDS